MGQWRNQYSQDRWFGCRAKKKRQMFWLLILEKEWGLLQKDINSDGGSCEEISQQKTNKRPVTGTSSRCVAHMVKKKNGQGKYIMRQRLNSCHFPTFILESLIKSSSATTSNSEIGYSDSPKIMLLPLSKLIWPLTYKTKGCNKILLSIFR